MFNFSDIFSALSDAKCCQYIREMIVSYLKERHADEQIDLIVGLEARGFLFSLMIATEMKCGCIPVRKMGKLPGKCFSIDYNLEYGQVCIKTSITLLLSLDLIFTGVLCIFHLLNSRADSRSKRMRFDRVKRLL